MNRKFTIACFALLALALPNQMRAQFTGNNQTNIISGVTSNWTGSYYVGSNYVFDALLILNGGVLNAAGLVGYTAAAKSNTVVVSGNDSVWNNGAQYVGYSGAGNTLEISNGGNVTSGGPLIAIGYNNTASNNSVLVTGNGSGWSITNTPYSLPGADTLCVGYLGASNSLVICAGASVVNSNSTIGSTSSGPAGGNGNTVLVTGSGSVWNNLGFLHVGDYSGNASSLVISNGARVANGDGAVGYSYASGNSVTVTGSGSVWSNSLSLRIGRGSYGNSLVISNGGQALVTGTNFPAGSYVGSGNTNSVLVTGNNSLWSSYGGVTVSGSGNSLVISTGGNVINNKPSYVGYGNGSSTSGSNSVLVTGSGSVWSNYDLAIGYSYGGGNSLVISNGGAVITRRYYSDQNGAVGFNSSASNNSVVVTGNGSVWSDEGDLYIGDVGSGNSLVIRDGGIVVNTTGWIGGGPNIGSSNNSVLVTGSGSVWSNRYGIHIGYDRPGNSLVVSNGGAVICPGGGSLNQSALITGNGSIWSLRLGLSVSGYAALTITNGGAVTARSLYFGDGYSTGSNRFIISGGSLWVTNDPGYLPGVLYIVGGTLTLKTGTITTDNLFLTDGAISVLAFYGGVLNSAGTAVTNTQPFIVGNGTNSATFHLLGGVHSFNDGLRIRTNSFLTGCGTINGDVTVDAGGTVLADCGGTLTFSGNVTNNGVMIADNGSVLESSGTLVNNGKILLFNGGTTNFTGTFINNGMVVDGGMVLLNPQRLSNKLVLNWTNAGFSLQTAQDLSAAFTNLPGATSPYTNPATAPQQFFRLKLN